MLLGLLVLVAAQEAPAAPPQVRFGHLRHVQLLEPREGRVRFATQVELGPKGGDPTRGTDSVVCVYEGGPLPDGERQEPVAELAVGSSMLRPFTWTNRPAWFLFELEGGTRLAALEPQRRLPQSEHAGGVLRLLDFPGGEERFALGGVEELEDACLRAGRGEFLARRGGELTWIRLASDGEIAERLALDPGLDVILAATIARGDASAPLRGWCVGLRGEALTAVPFWASGAEPSAAFMLHLDGEAAEDEVGARDTIRLAAWTGARSVHLAVGWPSYDRGVGRVALIDLSGADPVELWEGWLPPEVDDDISEEYDFGQAVAYVPDADEDQVPDLLVSSPTSLFNPSRVDLISGRTGELVARFAPGHSSGPGHWISVSSDSTKVLVGGTDYRTMPEDLKRPGHAHLLELPSMKPLATWVFELE